MKISSANIHFNEFGTPVAETFDDVYFSNENGLAETQYVFIDSNRLIERWDACRHPYFSIGETGFGTGLNFLLTVKRFLDYTKNTKRPHLQKLFYFSTEKFPLTLSDLKQALAIWPELNEYSDELIANYPLPLPGFHRISLFEDKVILDLFLGDAAAGFEQAHSHSDGRIDAWFLDGFAPSKNNDMWSEALFTAIARLSKPTATFATFTAAGAVKRGLRAAGFVVEKQKGFGKKREMLVGMFPPSVENTQAKQAPIYHRHIAETCSAVQPTHKKHVAVVGGGIAAAIMALKLLQRNQQVTLYCADNELAQGASGNDQGGFYPQLNAEAGIASQIHSHSFLYARRFYDSLLSVGANFAHEWCGVLQLAFNNNVTQRYGNMINNDTWPKDLVAHVSKTKASAIAGIDIPHSSLFLPLGGWLSPPELVKACIDLCANYAENFQLNLNHQLIELKTKENANKQELKHTPNLLFRANGQSKEVDDIDAIVLACGAESAALAQLDLPFRLTRGQVERIPSYKSKTSKSESEGIDESKGATELSRLKTVLCHKGYMTPAHDEYLAMGSTYIKNDTATDYRESDAQANLAMHTTAMADARWIDDITLNKGDKPGRAAIRCSLPDHLPTVGALPLVSRQKEELADLYKAKPDDYYPIPSVTPNTFVLTGLGSRGLTTAPLAAELLVSQLCNEPLPLNNQLLNALNPNRFLVKDLIRRR